MNKSYNSRIHIFQPQSQKNDFRVVFCLSQIMHVIPTCLREKKKFDMLFRSAIFDKKKMGENNEFDFM